MHYFRRSRSGQVHSFMAALTCLRSVETNLTLTCPSPKSFVCNLPDSGRHVTSVFQGLSLSRSVGRVAENPGNEVVVDTASYPCLTRPIGNNLLCSFKSIPDMEIRCKSAKDVLVGLYFLLAMERMFTSGKNLTQNLDPCFTKGCFLSLGITA